MKKNKILIIIIILISILAIAGTVFGYLFIATDTFKSDKELFSKYISQYIEEFQNITNFQTAEVYENLKNENKYELNTTIKVMHSEGGEISNPINNLSGKINVQKDKEEEYFYIDSQLLYEDEKYLQAEIIKEEEVYGARIPEVIEQFLTIENDENIEDLATEIGIDNQILQSLKNIQNSEQETISKEQIEQIKSKYCSIILSELENGIFEKQKNEDNNSYSLLLRSEQVKNILLKILNTIKEEEVSDNEEISQLLDGIVNVINEEEIPSIKITVFEKEQKTTKMVVEIESHIITFQFIENNKQLEITYSNSKKEGTYNLNLTKNATDKKEEIQLDLSIDGNEEENQISFLNTMTKSEDSIKLSTELSYKQDITKVAIQIENSINLGAEIKKNETLNFNNSRSINSLKPEKRTEFFEMLKRVIPQTINERIQLISQKMWNLEEGENSQNSEESQNEIPQVEINKFNAKFEFYTGDEVSAENVKILLDIVKNNCNGYVSITPESTEGEDANAKTSIMLYIEKDKINEQAITEILQKIKDNNKYRVSIKYKSENGLIDSITITEI